MIGEYAKGFEVGVESGKSFERERIIAALKSEEWDAPEIAQPYVQNIVALIENIRNA